MNRGAGLAAGLTLAALLAAACDAAAQVGGAARPAQKAAPRDAGERREPVTVDADRMERHGKENIVVFTGQVVARQAGSTQYADRTEVYLDEKGDRIVRIVSTGNVRVVTKDCKTGTARRAEYTDLDQRLSSSPVVSVDCGFRRNSGNMENR
jgi:lipopolysaccharide export system protein LptA